MTKQDLINDFWNDAEMTAKALGFGIAPDCADDLRAFITTGAERIEQDGLLSDYGRISQAQGRLIAFVGGMAREAKLKNTPMLQEFNFNSTKSSFCPLWPFC